jgi:ADP-ribose pyrophosphatase YjhB (NUDIX family)
VSSRHTRYQGAIVANDHILLLQHRSHADGRSWWTLPGGGIEPGETEEDCVRREMREETSLEVRIERLLLEQAGHPDGFYRWLKTYLCTFTAGEASPGYEPEPEAAASYALTAVRWLDLRSESEWGEAVVSNIFTYPQLKAIQAALGYR